MNRGVKRVLFLDVDGVLNNGRWAMAMYERGVRVYRDGLLYEPALWQLRRVVEATGAIIVLSSSWRLDPEAMENLRNWLERFGMEIGDVTPCMGGDRGGDITAWFAQNPGDCRYVILDDDDDMGVHRPRLVRTAFEEGLTEAEADRCIELLTAGDEGGRAGLSNKIKALRRCFFHPFRL